VVEKGFKHLGTNPSNIFSSIHKELWQAAFSKHTDSDWEDVL